MQAMTADQVRNASIRFTVLVSLMLQNASHALLTRYSQGILKESYSSTEVVLVSEVMKMCVAGYLSMRDKTETDAVGWGFSKLWWLAVNSKESHPLSHLVFHGEYPRVLCVRASRGVCVHRYAANEDHLYSHFRYRHYRSLY